MSTGHAAVHVTAATGTLLAALVTSSALAGPIDAQYSVQHTFSLTSGAASTPVTGVTSTMSARARELGLPADAFTRTRTDAITQPGELADSESAGLHRGTPGFSSTGATGAIHSTVSHLGPGNFSGVMRSFGTAQAGGQNTASASSRMATRSTLGSDWAVGQITWSADLHASGRRGSAHLSDPIIVTLPPPDPLWSPELFPPLEIDWDIEFADLETQTEVAWDLSGLRTTPNPTLNLGITMPVSPYTSTSGTLILTMVNGLVTQSLTTGYFVTFNLPAEGSTHPDGLVLPDFSNEFTINFNFDALGGRDFTIDFVGGGEMIILPAPGSAAVLCLAGLGALARGRRRG